MYAFEMSSFQVGWYTYKRNSIIHYTVKIEVLGTILHEYDIAQSVWLQAEENILSEELKEIKMLSPRK